MLKVKQIEVEKEKVVERKENKHHNFLKYWRVIRYWAKRKYDLSTEDIDILLYLYSEDIFKLSIFKEYESILNWNKNRFHNLIRRGLIISWRDKTSPKSRARLYKLSTKGKRICSTIYKKILQEENISESRVNNPIFGKASYSDKVYRNIIRKMNKKSSEGALKTDF